MTNKKIILAIDDNVHQLNEFKSLLVSKYDLRVVKSASEAVNYLNRNAADVILLDIEMPNISGFEFLKDIKKIPGYVNVPVIIVSGNSGNGFLRQVDESEAAGVLIKPVDPDRLIAAIENAASWKK